METDRTRDQSFPISSRDGVPVVTAPAEIDFSNAPAFESALAFAGTAGATIIVDMRPNVLCDSSGLSALIQAHKRAHIAEGELRLVMHPAHVAKVFKATGVEQFIKIFSTLSEAVAPVQH
jgi:anti-sigma B factor antagonist